MKAIPTHILEELSSLQFRIERIDHCNKYNPLDFHRHDYFEIFLFREGSGVHYIDFDAVEIVSNSVHFISPGQVHQVNRSGDTQGFVLLFSLDFLADIEGGKEMLMRFPLFFQQQSPPVLKVSCSDFEHLLLDLESMMSEYQGCHSQKKRILQSYVFIFLYRCMHWIERNKPVSPASHSFELFQRCREQLDRYYTTERQVAFYARALHVSVRQLNHALLKHSGKTLNLLIQERLLLEAKRMLRFSDRSVGMVAADLGFEDTAHFSKFIKKHTQHSPSDYRAVIV